MKYYENNTHQKYTGNEQVQEMCMAFRNKDKTFFENFVVKN